jgi:hypothetical protein
MNCGLVNPLSKEEVNAADRRVIPSRLLSTCSIGIGTFSGQPEVGEISLERTGIASSSEMLGMWLASSLWLKTLVAGGVVSGPIQTGCSEMVGSEENRWRCLPLTATGSECDRKE